MTIEFKCSECSKQYRVRDEFAGKRLKCKSCGAAIEVPSPDTGGSEDDFFSSLDSMVSMESRATGFSEADTPSAVAPVATKAGKPSRKKKKSKKTSGRGGLRTVATGLNLFLISLGLKIVTSLVFSFLTFDIFTRLRIDSITRISLAGMSLVALFFCLGTPKESRARELLIATLVAEGLSFLVTVMAIIRPMILVAGGVLPLISSIFFLLFLKRLSVYLDHYSGSDDVNEIFILYGVAIGLPLLFIPIAITVPFIASILGFLLPVGMLIVGIMILVKYIDLLASIRDRIYSLT